MAAFELEQLSSTFKETARLYPKTLPTSELTNADKIKSAMDDTIKAKDEARLDRSFADMTAACDQCHEANDRAFIVIRRPSFPSAFSNQLYGPRPSERKK